MIDFTRDSNRGLWTVQIKHMKSGRIHVLISLSLPLPVRILIRPKTKSSTGSELELKPSLTEHVHDVPSE